MTRPMPAVHRARGLALGVVLATLVIMAAMGVAVALSARTGAMTEEAQSDRAIATALLHQGANIQAAWDQILDRGVAATSVSLSTASGTGLYDPAGVALPVQTPPRAALAVGDPVPANYTWTLQTDVSGNPMVTLYNLGTSAGEYVAAAGPIAQNICQALNQLILGSNTISGGNADTADLYVWLNRPSATLIDMSSDTQMGPPEQCIQTADGYFVFYVTLQAG